MEIKIIKESAIMASLTTTEPEIDEQYALGADFKGTSKSSGISSYSSSALSF